MIVHTKVITISQTTGRHISRGGSDGYVHVCNFVFLWQESEGVESTRDSFEATQ